MFRRDLLHRRWGWCGWRPARLYPLRSRQPRNEAAEALRAGARTTEPSAEAVLAHLFLRLGGWDDLRRGLRAAGFDEAFFGHRAGRARWTSVRPGAGSRSSEGALRGAACRNKNPSRRLGERREGHRRSTAYLLATLVGVFAFAGAEAGGAIVASAVVGAGATGFAALRAAGRLAAFFAGAFLAAAFLAGAFFVAFLAAAFLAGAFFAAAFLAAGFFAVVFFAAAFLAGAFFAVDFLVVAMGVSAPHSVGWDAQTGAR
ncbi:MAG: hypothetical protein RML12_03125 [Xanthomonadales bacterium]|nr:hypothetical protein [Xanthomonadales bacterium]